MNFLEELPVTNPFSSPVKKFKRLQKKEKIETYEEPKIRVEIENNSKISNIQDEYDYSKDMDSKMKDLMNEILPVKKRKQKIKCLKRVPESSDEEIKEEKMKKMKKIKRGNSSPEKLESEIEAAFQEFLNEELIIPKKKVKKEKPAPLSNKDIIANLHQNPLFTMEEEDPEDRFRVENQEKKFEKKKGKKKEINDKNFKVRTRNKFFKTIDVRENPKYQDNFDNYYQDYDSRNKMEIEANFNPKTKNMNSFLSKFNSPNNSNHQKNDISILNEHNSKSTAVESNENTDNSQNANDFIKAEEKGSKLTENLISTITQQLGDDFNENVYFKIKSFAANADLNSNTLYLKQMFQTNSFLHKSMIENKGISCSSPSPIKKKNGITREDFKKQIMGNMKRRMFNFDALENLGNNFQETKLDELAQKIIDDQKREEYLNDDIMDDDENDDDYNPNENESEKSKEEVNEVEQEKENAVNIPEGMCIEEYFLQKQINENEEIEEKGQNEENNETDGSRIESSEKQFDLNDEESFEENSEDDNLENESIEKEDSHGDYLSENAEENSYLEMAKLDSPKPKRNFKKLKKVGFKLQKPEKKATWKDLFKAPVDPEKEKKIRSTFFETEAELGSDNEENDAIVKEINREADDEYEGEDLDQDFKELIDNVTKTQEGEEEELWNKFAEDVLKQDKEQLKKVLRGAYNINKKAGLDIDVNENEEFRKKLKMIEERIKMLEEQENIYGINNPDHIPNNKAEEIESEPEFEDFEALKLPTKKSSKIDFGSYLESDVIGMIYEKSDLIPLEEDYKTKLLKQRSSVLQAKASSESISQFKDNCNKEIINEYGKKMSLLQKQNSLNKIFMESHKQVAKSNSSKVFLFRNNSQMAKNN